MLKSIQNRHVIALGSYLVLAILLTYPLILHIHTHVPGQGVDDPAQTWSLWWVRYALINLGISPLTTDYLFYPVGINLVAYTPTFLNGILSIPLQLVYDVIPAANFIVYFAFVMSGYGAFLLAREILHHREIDSDIGAFLAGAFFAFGAWHVHYADATYMLLSCEWIPFYVLYLFRLERDPIRNGTVAGFFLLLNAWTELTLAMFLAIFTALYLVWWFIKRLFETRNLSAFVRASLRPILGFALLGIIALIGSSPLLYSLFNDTQRFGYYLSQGMGRVQIFSAELISFLFPSPQNPILGAWAKSITMTNTRYAFIGYAALVLVIIGIIANRKSRETIFWVISSLVFASLMLGPSLIVAGQNTDIPMPFALLRAIPFVNANRYPVRFNIMLMFSLMPLIAFGAARLLQLSRGKIILGVLSGLLVVEQLVIPIPLSDLRVPAIFETIRNDPGDFAVLNVPLGWRGSVSLQGKMEDQAQFFQTVHTKRMLGGITSRTPRFKTQYFLEAPVIQSIIALESGNQVDDHRRALDRTVAVEVLRFFDVRYVNVNRALAGDALTQYIVDTFPLTEIYRDDTRTVYRINSLPTSFTNHINGNLETARLYFDDRWGRVQYFDDGVAYRWATQGESAIWLPLNEQDQRVTFRIRGTRANQRMVLRVNGALVTVLVLNDTWEEYRVPIPASALREGLDEFVFVTDTVAVGATRQDNYSIGGTGIVSPVDISVTGAGFEAGRFGEIFVAGRSVIENKRGYQLVAINPQSGTVERIGSFDTFAGANESARLAKFVNDLPNGEIVAGVAIDDVSKNLSPAAVEALHQLGVEADLRFEFRAGHAFIGVKGAPMGSVLESVEGRLPANVSVGKNVASDRAAFALSWIEFDR